MTTGEDDHIRVGSGYELTSWLGSGATGAVWRGVRADGTAIAVKVLDPGYGRQAAVVDRFRAERSVLIGMRSPHLVPVHDLVAEGDTLAIVMDLMDDGDLRTYLDSGAPLEPALAFALAGDVLSALGAVHDAGMLHQDVKPANIMMDLRDPDRPRALLTDVGIARGIGEATGDVLIRTPNYLAPELLSGRATPSAGSDLFGVGAVLFEMLTGQRHQGGRTLHGLPDKASALLAGLLDPDPARRPRSAAQARDQLLAAGRSVAGMDVLPSSAGPEPTYLGPTYVEPAYPPPAYLLLSTPPATPSAAATSAPPTGGRRGALIAGAVAAAAVLVVGLALAGPGGNDDQATGSMAGAAPAASPQPSVEPRETTTPAPADRPYGGEADLAAAFTDIVPANPGDEGRDRQTCLRVPAQSAGSVGKILCKYPDGQQLSLLRYASAADRDARARQQIRADGAVSRSWSAGLRERRPEGIVLTGDRGDGPYRWWTYDTVAARETYAVNVRWNGRTAGELARWWNARAPF